MVEQQYLHTSSPVHPKCLITNIAHIYSAYWCMHVFYDPLTFWTTSNFIIEPPTNREMFELKWEDAFSQMFWDLYRENKCLWTWLLLICRHKNNSYFFEAAKIQKLMDAQEASADKSFLSLLTSWLDSSCVECLCKGYISSQLGHVCERVLKSQTACCEFLRKYLENRFIFSSRLVIQKKEKKGIYEILIWYENYGSKRRL